MQKSWLTMILNTKYKTIISEICYSLAVKLILCPKLVICHQVWACVNILHIAFQLHSVLRIILLPIHCVKGFLCNLPVFLKKSEMKKHSSVFIYDIVSITYIKLEKNN